MSSPIKSLFLFTLGLVISVGPIQAAAPWDHGPLQVSANGRYFQQADGTPFFWLGDTAWLITQKLGREDIKTYLENRRAKGFNVVQCCLVQNFNDKSPNGTPALVDEDLARLNITPGNNPDDPAQYDYWDHVDYLVDTAASNGIYVAMSPMWRYAKLPAPEKGAAFAAQVAARYAQRPNVIWVNGGSSRGGDNPAFWNAAGAALKRHAPGQLVTFHPFGRMQSSDWFVDAPWLDFNMFVSGHRRYDQDTEGKRFGEDNWRYVLADRAKAPGKPTLDGEPAYENTPQGLHKPEEPYWNDNDVRRYAYWSVFAGAAGHTYGENSVRQIYLPGESRPSSGAKGFIMDRLEADGAGQMQHLKNLMLSRPYFDRIDDQSVVAGDEGEQYDRVLVTRGQDYLFAYTYTGRSFRMNLGAIAGRTLNTSWFNPRTGDTIPAGTRPNTGVATFDPPGEPAAGNDWVLILDTAGPGSAANFSRPRVIMLSDFPPLDVIPGGGGKGPPEKLSDPDDIQSMVRFLLYSNDLEVEGLIASAGTHANIANKQNLMDILDLYDQVDENLRRHDPRYPTADRLRGRIWQGRDKTWGKPAEEIIGEGRDTEASEAIIRIVDRPDPRPVWVGIWGGPCEVAQAIWKVQHTRSPEDLQRFLGKLRLFMIGLGSKTGQDGSGQWLLDTFPNLFMIVSQKTYSGMFAQKTALGSLEWLNTHIREGHGPLGAIYPRSGYYVDNPGMQEGDTPTFLHLVSALRGLNDPDKPDQEGWGGQYVRRDPARNHWYDGPGADSIRRWLPDIQADFANRARWMLPPPSTASADTGNAGLSSKP
jgi:hypothetical protein